MNQKNTKALLKKYSKLYCQYYLPMSETAMCWGFPGDGWYKLIDKLSKKLVKLDPEMEASTVKEKFGGLRFYTNGVDKDNADNIYKVIQEAEDESYKTCEECGKPGKPNENGWIITLCKSCRIKRVKRFKKEIEESKNKRKDSKNE